MKKHFLGLSLILLVVFFTVGCKNEVKNPVSKKNSNTVVKKNNETQVNNNTDKTSNNEVVQLTSEQFKDLIFDYENNQEWQYQGKKPCVIDFYADWCGPCKLVAPIMEELAKEYKGKVIFYKINVDNEKSVAQVFGIQSIPSVLFVPKKGKPQMSVGAMQKEGYTNAIKQILNVQ